MFRLFVDRLMESFYRPFLISGSFIVKQKYIVKIWLRNHLNINSHMPVIFRKSILFDYNS